MSFLYKLLPIFIILIISSGAFAISNTGLKGYWDLNDASGNPVDHSGNGVTGTSTNIIYGQTGKVGTDFNFFKPTTYGNVDFNNSTYFVPAVWTWCWWGKKINNDTYPYFWISRDGGAATNDSYSMSYYGANDYMNMHNTAGTAFQIDMGNNGINTWNFYCMSFSNNVMYGWVNGVLKAPKAFTGTVYTGATNTRFGTRAGGTYNLKGAIDEVSFWDRNLTKADITDLYNSGSGVTYCQSTGLFGASCSGASDPCAPTINADWNISTTITCTNKNISLGTGTLNMNPGGYLKLYDSNVHAKYIKLNASGPAIQLFSRSFLRIK